MGKLIQGINGPISGKVGTVVGSSIDGVPYIKSTYKKRTEKISEKEQHNRNRFAVAQAWIRPIIGFVKQGFRAHMQDSRGFVKAVGYTLKHALTETDGQLLVDPALVMISRGTLELPQHIQMQCEGNELILSWEALPPHTKNADNQVVVLAYGPEEKLFFGTTTGQFLKTGQERITLPKRANLNYHIYFAVISSDRSAQSDSIFLGTVMV